MKFCSTLQNLSLSETTMLQHCVFPCTCCPQEEGHGTCAGPGLPLSPVVGVHSITIGSQSCRWKEVEGAYFTSIHLYGITSYTVLVRSSSYGFCLLRGGPWLMCRSWLNLALCKSSSSCLVNNQEQLTPRLDGGKGAYIIYWTI